MKHLIYPLLLLVFFQISSLTACSSRHSDTGAEPANIATLDSLIERRNDIERAKLIRIAELRQKLNGAQSASDRYMFTNMLAGEFFPYNSDSAKKYIDQSIAIAERAGNTEWLTRNKIRKASLLTGSGLLKEALDIMSTIDRKDVSKELLTEYYGQMIYLYSHLGNYAGGDEASDYYMRERVYKDSIMAVIDSTHPEYLWYRGWDILGTDKSTADVIGALKRKLAGSGLDAHQDAKDAYILARLYQQDGNIDSAKKYMALSAIVDVRTANAEIASLEELAKLMFENGNGDIDHAYHYINYSLNKAISYPNRVRAFGISETIDSINKAWQERNRRSQNRTTLFLVLVCILATVLAVTIGIIIVQNRRLRLHRRSLDTANKKLTGNVAELSEAHKQLNEANTRLNEANARLTALNDDLKVKNDELSEANYVKEEYIGYIFTICSDYIGKLEEFRKNIHMKAMTRKFKDIVDETSSTDMMKDELREFYRSFDTIFLHIYPDFVNDFNALLQDDKRIIPKEGELLNTELRIYALVRLGITDSVKIAEFLHCSPQTVYNNRFRVRNKALVPKKDFAEEVRKLGKFSDRPA